MLKKRVMNTDIPYNIKCIILDRIENMEADKQKEMQWIESLLKIPFGKYSKIPIDKDSSKEEINNFFNFSIESLDKAAYGMKNVKEEIINYIAQFISTNNNSMPRIIALHGVAGIGKTNIIRNGLSKALNRPMKCISMGGLRDSSHFIGFDYTYSGSRYGIILQTLMETRVMNPIIFMDELDKISMTNEGIEIQNLLIHLTDPVQNNTFQDKYFAGIHIDLSKAVFIFAFNDIDNIHPVLKDRLHIIKVPEPTFDEKVIICKNYLLPDICNNIGINKDDINISNDVIKNLIKKYCNKDKGVRNLKRKLESILLKINLAKYIDKGSYSILNRIEFPYTIKDDIVDLLLKNDKNENDIPDHVMNMFL